MGHVGRRGGRSSLRDERPKKVEVEGGDEGSEGVEDDVRGTFVGIVSHDAPRGGEPHLREHRDGKL